MPDAEDRYEALRKGSRPLDKLCFYTNKGKKAFFGEMLLLMLGAAMLAFIPFALGKFMDNIKAKDWGLVDLRGEHMLMAAVITIAFFAIWYLLISVGRKKYVLNIAMNKTRREILRKIDSKDVRDTEKKSAGTYVGFITNEQQVLAKMMNNDVVMIAEGIFLFTVMIILMAVTEIKLAAIYLVLLPVTCYVIYRTVKHVKENAKERQKAFRRMNGYLDDVSTNYRMIRMYGLEEQSCKTFVGIDEDLSEYYKRVAFRTCCVSPIGRILENTGYVLSALAGVTMLMADMISIGMLLSFVSYASVIGKPLTNIANGIGNLRENIISMNNISKLLTSEEDTRHGTISADDSDGDISIRDLTIMSDDGRVLLESASCDIRHGEHVSVIGASGSGKSLLIDAIIAMYRPERGSVLYGGRDVFEYERNSLRHSISVIPTRPWIFSGTIMENIRYVRPDATDEEIIAVSKRIGFDDAVRRMGGYDMVISENNQRFSLGFNQMISLVRLLLTDPKVIIFDDSMSGLDVLTVYRIRDNVKDYFKGRTVIFVSDDKPDLFAAERFIFLCDGRMTVGTHEQLMKDSRYADALDQTI